MTSFVFPLSDLAERFKVSEDCLRDMARGGLFYSF
jgi:hypothetical protein